MRDGPSSDVVLEYRRQLHEDEKVYYAALKGQPIATAASMRATPPPVGDSRTIVPPPQADIPAHVDDAQADRLDNHSFGDLDCSIQQVRTYDAHGEECAYFLPGDTIRIEVAGKAHVALDRLNVNVRIRNKEGVKMYSWGTLNQDIANWASGELGLGVWGRHFAAGESFVVDFEFECTLGMNFYEVQVSVSEEMERYQGAQRMLHWRDEAAFFQVGVRSKEYPFGGVCYLRMRAHVG